MTIYKWFRILMIILVIVSIGVAAGCITVTAPDLGSGEQPPPPVSTPTPTPPEPPPEKQKPSIELFRASPDTINTGQISTLNWSVTGAQVVTIDNGIGSVALVGSRAVQPPTSTTFTLTATNEAGSVTATVAVLILAGSTVGNPVIEFTAAYLGGNSWQLNWNVANSTEQIIEPEVGPIPALGSTTVTVPSGQTKTYTLKATNSWGWAHWNVTLMSP
jgi:hypothetical protein